MRSTVLVALAAVLAGCAENAPTQPQDTPSLALGNVNGNKLLCFQGFGDGYGSNGWCTLTPDGTATLNNNDGDLDPYNNYSGVYLQNSNMDGKRLSDIGQLGFVYTGTPGAGAPRFSIPVDTDGDGDTEWYMFISAYYCNDGAGGLDALVDPTCTIWAGSESFVNWAALLAAHPEYRVGKNLPFVIADEQGLWTVGSVRLGKGAAKAAK